MPARRFVLVAGALITLVAVACQPSDQQATPVDSVAATPIAWAFHAPAAWDDRVEMLEEDVAAEPGVRSKRTFRLVSADSGVPAQILLGVSIWTIDAWARLVNDGGPPPGDSLAGARGHVYVASLPQSNPFAPESPSYRAFDSLSVGLSDIRARFRVLPPM